MNNKIEYDRVTKAWLDQHPGYVPNLSVCKLCDLYFDSRLGHSCELRGPGFAPDGYMADGTPIYLKCGCDSSAASMQLALYKLLTEKGELND